VGNACLIPDWLVCVCLVFWTPLRFVQRFRGSPPRATHFSLKCAKKSKQKKAHPIIRPRLRRGSFAPSSLRGSAYKGHPWPFKPLAASMPLAPLRNDCAHPPEGAIRTPETMGLIQVPWRSLLLLPEHSQLHLSYRRFRRVQSPPRRVNGVVAQEVERQDVARATAGHGWPIAAGLWSGDGVSEPWRSQGRMNGRRVLVTLPAKSLVSCSTPAPDRQ
jgi:hypothetical protein